MGGLETVNCDKALAVHRMFDHLGCGVSQMPGVHGGLRRLKELDDAA